VKTAAGPKRLDAAAEARRKIRERMAATNAALKQAKAEVIATRKRQALLEKMAEKKEKAIAAFVERWQKKEMAKIDKAMSPRKSKG
jgi:hypothetical protein